MSATSFFNNTLLTAFLGLPFFQAQAQPVATVDAAALLAELPSPPADLAQAYARAYPNGATSPDTKAFYQAWTGKLEAANTQVQNLSVNFYRQNPTGVRAAAPAPSRVTPGQQSAMNAATSELAQKMMNDPAFAQQFASMSEADQQAYITKLLAEKGVRPASGQPNMPSALPAGLDRDWAGLCTELMQTSADMHRWDAQTALQQRYDERHREVDTWAAAEINRLPMIEMGEYGHDHDPEKVKAIQQQAARRHADLADAMMKEALPLLAGYRQECLARITPLNNELKNVGYGNAYDFGVHYPLVLQTQGMMLSDLSTVLTNEISLIEACAGWEKNRRTTPANQGLK